MLFYYFLSYVTLSPYTQRANFFKDNWKIKLNVIFPWSVYNPPIDFFETVPLSHQALLNANLFQRIFNSLWVFRENAKTVLSLSENSQKYLIIFIECAYTEITALLEWFYLYKVVSEYAKSISYGRREYLAVFGKHADRYKIEPNSTNILPKPKKIQIPNHPPIVIHDQMGQKTYHAAIPLKTETKPNFI